MIDILVAGLMLFVYVTCIAYCVAVIGVMYFLFRIFKMSNEKDIDLVKCDCDKT